MISDVFTKRNICGALIAAGIGLPTIDYVTGKAGNHLISDLITDVVGAASLRYFPNAIAENPNGLISNIQFRYFTDILCDHFENQKLGHSDLCDLVCNNSILFGQTFLEDLLDDLLKKANRFETLPPVYDV